MPSARKPDRDGNMVDFDAVYREIITPAIERAGLEPLRSYWFRSDGPAIHTSTMLEVS